MEITVCNEFGLIIPALILFESEFEKRSTVETSHLLAVGSFPPVSQDIYAYSHATYKIRILVF